MVVRESDSLSEGVGERRSQAGLFELWEWAALNNIAATFDIILCVASRRIGRLVRFRGGISISSSVD